MGELRDLLDARGGDTLELHAEYANPQMVRVLRTIGFDRDWARTEGAYLYDAGGDRYLDWLGGDRTTAIAGFDTISQGAKTFILKAARAVNSKKPFDPAPQFAEWATAYDAALAALAG